MVASIPATARVPRRQVKRLQPSRADLCSASASRIPPVPGESRPMQNTDAQSQYRHARHACSRFPFERRASVDGVGSRGQPGFDRQARGRVSTSCPPCTVSPAINDAAHRHDGPSCTRALQPRQGVDVRRGVVAGVPGFGREAVESSAARVGGVAIAAAQFVLNGRSSDPCHVRSEARRRPPCHQARRQRGRRSAAPFRFTDRQGLTPVRYRERNEGRIMCPAGPSRDAGEARYGQRGRAFAVTFEGGDHGAPVPVAPVAHGWRGTRCRQGI